MNETMRITLIRMIIKQTMLWLNKQAHKGWLCTSRSVAVVRRSAIFESSDSGEGKRTRYPSSDWCPQDRDDPRSRVGEKRETAASAPGRSALAVRRSGTVTPAGGSEGGERRVERSRRQRGRRKGLVSELV